MLSEMHVHFLLLGGSIFMRVWRRHAMYLILYLDGLLPDVDTVSSIPLVVLVLTLWLSS